MSDKMKLWDSVCETNPGTTKAVNDGKHSFTAIDAYSQIKKATELWGPYGSTWGLNNIQRSYLEDAKLSVLMAIFKYPDGEFPISSSIKYMFNNGKPDDDFAKKQETDAITKALSRLGFNADVFMGKFDDNKYVQQMRDKFKESYTPEQKQWFDEFMSNEDSLGIFLFSQRVDQTVTAGLFNSFEKGQITKKKELHRKLENQGADIFFAIEEALDSNDGMKLVENIGVLNKKTLAMLKSRLNDTQKSTFDELYKVNHE